MEEQLYMGTFLKFLSLLTGSDEETMLKARAEVAHAIGSSKVSNIKEKEYVFDCYLNLIANLTDPNEINKYSLGYTLMSVTDNLTQNYLHEPEMVEFLQAVNRVLVHYYGFILGNPNTLTSAFEKMGNDLEIYLKKFL